MSKGKSISKMKMAPSGKFPIKLLLSGFYFIYMIINIIYRITLRPTRISFLIEIIIAAQQIIVYDASQH